MLDLTSDKMTLPAFDGSSVTAAETLSAIGPVKLRFATQSSVTEEVGAIVLISCIFPACRESRFCS
jgi:hypothetical protein